MPLINLWWPWQSETPLRETTSTRGRHIDMHIYKLVYITLLEYISACKSWPAKIDIVCPRKTRGIIGSALPNVWDGIATESQIFTARHISGEEDTIKMWLDLSRLEVRKIIAIKENDDNNVIANVSFPFKLQKKASKITKTHIVTRRTSAMKREDIAPSGQTNVTLYIRTHTTAWKTMR